MAEENGSYDWNARMRRLEDSVAANWDDHARMNRNLEALRASVLDQKTNVDTLVYAIHSLIDRIPPENLR